MKIFLITTGVVAIVFTIIQIYAMSSQKDIETYPFKLVKKFDKFEVRQYEATLFTSVKLSTNEYEKGSSQGFSILAGYIFGGNETNEKIAMTSPVAMSLEDSMTVMFMVPKKMNKESLPKPNQSKIEFKEEPAKTVAAIRFGGWANSDKIESHKQQLIAALEAENIGYTNNFFFLGYNAPYEVANRKNEVIVELKDYPTKKAANF
jgi:hypothetical protein